MNLLAQINEAATSLEETTTFTTKNLERLMECSELSATVLNETATQFLNTYAQKIQDGVFNVRPDNDAEEKRLAEVKKNVIDIFAALKALSQQDLADAFDDVQGEGLGTVLSNFYGAAGKEQHKVAQNRLASIGKRVGATYQQQAEQMVNSPEKIRNWSDKIRTNIDTVMRKLLAHETIQSNQQLDKEKQKEKADNQAQVMQGTIPQRS